MKEISRRRFFEVAGGIVVPLAVPGCGVLSGILDFDPSDIQTYLDTYVIDLSLPSLGDEAHAQKLYVHSENNLNDPGKLLFAGDFDHARFRCSAENPLDIVVGFAREFSRVGVNGYWNSRLNVAGYVVNPVSLAGIGEGTIRFVNDLSRGEEGYAVPRPLDDFGSGGSLQIDTGPGRSRYFRFIAYPESGEDEMGIDYMVLGG